MLTWHEYTCLLVFARCDRDYESGPCSGACVVAMQILDEIECGDLSDAADLAESLAYSNKSSA